MTRTLRLVLLLAMIAWGGGAQARTQEPAAPAPAAPAAESTQPAPASPQPPPPSTPPRARRPPRPATPPAAPPAPAEDASEAAAATTEEPESLCDQWSRNPTFRLGQSYVVRRGEAVRDAVAVFGDVLVEGEVCGDLSVTLGDVRLARGAVVHGTLVVVAGTLTVEPTATVLGELVLVGGALDAPADFRAGRDQIIVGIPLLGEQIRSVGPYFTRGLLLGRLIVPDIGWVWSVVGVLLFVYLLINLLFPQATWAATSAIAERPLSTFAAGLLVLVLSGPIAALLAVTVVGIAALPVLLGALLLAWVVGKIAVCRWIGTRVFAQDDPDDRLQSSRSFLIGFVVVTIAYMIPVLGILVWGLTGVLGLGGATLALIRAFRRENPPPAPRIGRPAMTPPAVPPAAFGTVGPTAPAGPAAPAPADADLMMNRSASADGFALPPPAFAGEVPPAPAAVPGMAGVADDRALLAFPHAGFAERAAAFVLDFVLVMLTVAMFDPRDPGNVIIVLLVAYHVAFWLWKRTTLGGIICQLRVTRVDGAPLRFVDALVRGVTAIFSLAAFGIGALWILRDPERQAWHDKVAGTYVVRVPRNYPLP